VAYRRAPERVSRPWRIIRVVVRRGERSRLSPIAAAIALAACDWGRPLDSDPKEWSPEATAVEAGAAALEGGAPTVDAAVIPAACAEEPPFDPGLTQSSATATSHRAGEPCLEKCHEAGGSARTVLAVGGTIHPGEGDRSPVAIGGTVSSVAGSTLTLDRCGNFYAVASALATTPQNTQPFVQNPMLHRMEKPLYREQYAGSCNRVGCHDFSSSSKSGIYY